jgi:SAM-dependent methyltransferase
MCTKNTYTLDDRLAALMQGGDVIVELGCGDGYALDTLANLYKTVIGIDISDARLLKRPHKPQAWKFIQSDLNKRIPFDSNTVDLIFANQVIEHIADPVFFVKEIYRVLIPGGGVVLTTPNIRYLQHVVRLVISGKGPKTADNDNTDGPWDDGHRCYFTHRDLREIFNSVGFREIKTRAFIDVTSGQFIRSLFDYFSKSCLIKEFMSGNILLVANK